MSIVLKLSNPTWGAAHLCVFYFTLYLCFSRPSTLIFYCCRRCFFEEGAYECLRHHLATLSARNLNIFWIPIWNSRNVFDIFFIFTIETHISNMPPCWFSKQTLKEEFYWQIFAWIKEKLWEIFPRGLPIFKGNRRNHEIVIYLISRSPKLP